MVPPKSEYSKDIEETSLEAHVRICDIRYEVLNKKHDQLDKKLEDLNRKIEDIYKILQDGKNTMNSFIAWGSAIIIIILIAAMIGLIVWKH